jgi:hypothetical protein
LNFFILLLVFLPFGLIFHSYYSVWLIKFISIQKFNIYFNSNLIKFFNFNFMFEKNKLKINWLNSMNQLNNFLKINGKKRQERQERQEKEGKISLL